MMAGDIMRELAGLWDGVESQPMTLMVSREIRRAFRRWFLEIDGVRVKGSRGMVLVRKRGDRWRVVRR